MIAFGILLALTLVTVLWLGWESRKPVSDYDDIMDAWVQERLAAPPTWDRDGAFDRLFHDAGLCTAVDCEAVIDEDYPL